jgi:DNA-binding transcriptional ArsR family regulator
MNSLNTTDKELVKMAKLFKALGDETRLKILYLLEGERNVNAKSFLTSVFLNQQLLDIRNCL